MPIVTTITADPDKFGIGMKKNSLDKVERLRSMCFELQKRVELMESSMIHLKHLVEHEPKILESTELNYSLNVLMLQLFRIAVVDCNCCISDKGNSKSVSLRAIVDKLLQPTEKYQLLLGEYYSTPEAFKIKIEGGDGDLNAVLRKTKDECLNNLREEYSAISRGYSEIFDSISSKRLKWARDKIVAHFERKPNQNQLIQLDVPPPFGDGVFTWLEPIEYFESCKDYIYQVFRLITSNSWHSSIMEHATKECDEFWSKIF